MCVWLDVLHFLAYFRYPILIQRSRYSDTLRAERSAVRIPVRHDRSTSLMTPVPPRSFTPHHPNLFNRDPFKNYPAIYAMHLSLIPITELIRQLCAPSVTPKHCPLHPALEQKLPLMRYTTFHSHTNQRQAPFTLCYVHGPFKIRHNTLCLY
jgi:hypothetical protein